MYSDFSVLTAEQWQTAVTSGGRYVKTKIVFNSSTTLYGDGTDGAVVSIVLDETMESANGISLGGTASSQCVVEIRQPSTPINLANSTFIPYVGLLYSGSIEYIPLGVFYTVSADTNSGGGTVTVTGYDKFAKLNDTYSPSIEFPATTTNIMADLAVAGDFTFSSSVTERTLETYHEGTIKEYIGWLAGLEGKNARFGRTGNLEFTYYDASSYEYSVTEDNQYMGGFDVTTVGNVVVTALVSGTEQNTINSGTGRAITFFNPYMTQTILDSIKTAVVGTDTALISFRPAELQWRGNPCVQCGDVIGVQNGASTETVYCMSHTLSVQGGMQDTLRCYGQSDSQLALDKTPTERKIQQAYSALQNAIANATAVINGTQGGVFEITQSNGINTGWLIKESPEPNYMGNVIVANYNGIGFSQNGGSSYATAITTDGHINGQYLTAHSVDVDTLSVGSPSNPFTNYIYIGRRRPNDDTTEMVIRISVATQSMVQEIRGNRTSIFNATDIESYVNGSLTDEQLDAKALMYYSDTDYVLLNLGSFRIGDMLMQKQASGGVKFIKAT